MRKSESFQIASLNYIFLFQDKHESMKKLVFSQFDLYKMRKCAKLLLVPFS